MPAPDSFDTIILGAGAAGLICAPHAAARGGRVLVLDHAEAPGEKIRVSGGGRCNFTNLHCAPDRFLSANPHFAKSALRRYTPADFIALVTRHGIAFHEKTLGQLFCDGSARQIVAMLLAELTAARVELRLSTALASVARTDGGFTLALASGGVLTCRHLVVATGGKSIPKMGASPLGYRIAEQFGLALTETRPGLVPLTFGDEILTECRALAGTALPARATFGKTAFDEALLFTHRGLSGPAILQISSYWRESAPITLDLLPGQDLAHLLRDARRANGKRAIATVLADHLPRRLGLALTERLGLTGTLADTSDRALAPLVAATHRWQPLPIGTEGYRTAEVTLGGVDIAGLDSTTLGAKSVPGLHFIGEVVDVTGWLGGYNFQWAWSSGWAAGTAIAAR